MTGPAAMNATQPLTSLDPAPLLAPQKSWLHWLGPVISLAILVGVLHAFTRFEIRADLRLVPHNIVFWMIFAGYYLSTPFWEWVIYRKLWSIPWSGFVALLRKHITNELLLGYLGEVYFYGWARQQGRITAAPFGAIKDVTILSAVCGNLIAVATLPLGIQLLQSLFQGISPRLLALSIGAFLATPLLPVIFRRRLFSLRREQLWFVALIHFVRVALTMVLYAALWHMVLPADSFGWWLLLAALRQFVSRLPLVPNKEILFAGIAVFFLGQQSEIAALLALFGSFTLLLHILIGMVVGASGLVEKVRS